MLTKIDALKDGDYRFFESDTGNKYWKVKLVVNASRPALVDAPVPLAVNEFSVTVTVSPVDETGKAIRDVSDLPIVIDSHTHTFTSVEQASPDYNPEKRIMSIVEERVITGQLVIDGNQKIQNLVGNWSN